MPAGVEINIAEARAPYVTFERRAVEDRAASIAQGRWVTKDVDFAIITPPGSKDQIERVVEEWLTHIEQESRVGRFPTEWVKAYKFAHSEWKEGREIPVDGTPVANWAVPSPAQIDSMRQLKIRTVEDMAQANEDVILRMGMGARQLKDLAINFLRGGSAEGQSQLATEIAALKAKVDNLERANSQLQRDNSELASKVPNAAAPQQTAAGGDGLDFLGTTGDDLSGMKKL